MLSQDPQFKKIKVKARGLGGTATYWLGPDHLLVVTVDGYHERYRRIYFRDIQALIIRQTNGWNWITILIIGMLIVGGILPVTTGDPVAQIFGGIILGVSAIMMTLNFVAGRSCGCRLITAVQNRDLPYISRWKQASRLLDALQPEVNRTQRPAIEPNAPVGAAAPATDQATT